MSNDAVFRSFDDFARKLVQYCVLKGYLRRVREYRVSLDDPSTDVIHGNESGQEHNNGSSENGAASKPRPKKSSKDLYDGTQDMDSLSCLGYGKSRRETCHLGSLPFVSFSVDDAASNNSEENSRDARLAKRNVFDSLEIIFFSFS